MAPDYDHLSLMQKVEVFEHALEHTQGDDFAKILCLGCALHRQKFGLTEERIIQGI